MFRVLTCPLSLKNRSVCFWPKFQNFFFFLRIFNFIFICESLIALCCSVTEHVESTSVIATLWPFFWKASFLISPWLDQNSLLAVLNVTCLFWQSGESLKTQSGPFRFLTVWDWAVQFDPKAQAFLNNPLYAEKPKPDKSQRKTARFKVRYVLLNCFFNSGNILHILFQMYSQWKYWCNFFNWQNKCVPQTHLDLKNPVCTDLSFK